MDRLKVLMLEDIWEQWYPFQRRFHLLDLADVLVAEYVEQAFDFYKQHPDFALMTIDAWMPFTNNPKEIIDKNRPATAGFVQHVIASGFTGPIIAASACKLMNHALEAAGCTHVCLKGENGEQLYQVVERMLRDMLVHSSR